MGLPYLKGLRLALAGLLVGVAFIAIACGDDEGGDSEGATLSAVASTTIVQDLVRQVGGDRVSVESIVPAGADVHTYALTPSDIRKATEASLVVIVGSDLSAIEQDLADSAGGAVLELTHDMELRPFPEGLAHADEHDHGHEDEDDHGHEDEDDHGHEDEDDHGHEDEDDHGHEDEDDHHGHAHGEFDPHFWMDIDLTIEAVEAIRDELSRLDPEGADYYAERADDYIAELRELDEEIREQLAALPEERRYLVTFHDAYGYFADRYGLTILGFVVEGPEEEPSASAITELVESIEELGIPYIFSEPQFSARVIEQIARDTGTTVRTIPSGALAEEYPTYVEFLRAIANGIAE
ncbi:MAG: metal ABC transporter substrate-binding protein [Gemmatimonadetes bacterium]|nr:metal ABC transporter substrate-binding protein [Gemmatimonadota bacterium]